MDQGEKIQPNNKTELDYCKAHSPPSPHIMEYYDFFCHY